MQITFSSAATPATRFGQITPKSVFAPTPADQVCFSGAQKPTQPETVTLRHSGREMDMGKFLLNMLRLKMMPNDGQIGMFAFISALSTAKGHPADRARMAENPVMEEIQAEVDRMLSAPSYEFMKDGVMDEDVKEIILSMLPSEGESADEGLHSPFPKGAQDSLIARIERATNDAETLDIVAYIAEYGEPGLKALLKAEEQKLVSGGKLEETVRKSGNIPAFVEEFSA